MTAPHASQPRVLPRPACTPTAIRAVLAPRADGDILQRWWFEADAWRDPRAQWEFLARTCVNLSTRAPRTLPRSDLAPRPAMIFKAPPSAMSR